MSAFGGKADIAGTTLGRRSLNGKAARKRPPAKKIVDTEGSFFCVFVFRLPGVRGSHRRFFELARRKKFAFVFQSGLRKEHRWRAPWGALVSFVHPRPHGATPTKGRAIECCDGPDRLVASLCRFPDWPGHSLLRA